MTLHTKTLWVAPLLLALGLSLSAEAAGKKTATLKLHVKPPDTQLILDDKPLGEVGAEKILTVAPGRHLIKLKRKQVSHEEPVMVKAGETKSWAFEFSVDDPKDEVKLEDSPPPTAE